MYCYQTKTRDTRRPVLTRRLPIVLILWNAFILLTGCNRSSALTTAPPTQASMVNWYDLTEESSEESFEQFFTERHAKAIWHRLCFCLNNPQTLGSIDETTLAEDSAMHAMLSQQAPHLKADLRKAIRLYIVHKKQLDLTQELAFEALLHDNGLYKVWEILNQARGKYALDLKGMLQGLPKELQSQVIGGMVHFIGKHLPNLLVLDLSYNGLTQLPHTFVKLTKLEGLYLEYNQLNELPEFFEHLMNLRVLELGHNQLTVLPEFLQKLTNLKVLTIRNNPIQGFTQETAFQDFLHHNRLDAVWQRLNQAKDKDTLDLRAMLKTCNAAVRSQVMEGVVHFIRNHIPALVELDLSSNRLTELPDTFVNLIHLQRLYLGYNQLTAFCEQLINLRQLNLSCNRLTHLPDSFGNLINLNGLNLSDNQLTHLPNTFGNLTQLERLELYDNELTHLPDSFGNLTQLSELYLSENQLTHLPDTFGNLTQLEILGLYNNQLTTLPGSFKNLTKLRVFIVRNNPFLNPNATLHAPDILVTSDNLKLKPFPRQEYVRQHSLNSTFNYDFNREIFEIKRPDNATTYIHSYQRYPTILFIKKLGELTLSQPVPLSISLSGSEIAWHAYSGDKMIITNQGTINRHPRQ